MHFWKKFPKFPRCPCFCDTVHRNRGGKSIIFVQLKNPKIGVTYWYIMNYCIFGGNFFVPPKNSKKQLDSRSKITQYLCCLKLYVFCAILTAGSDNAPSSPEQKKESCTVCKFCCGMCLIFEVCNCLIFWSVELSNCLILCNCGIV